MRIAISNRQKLMPVTSKIRAISRKVIKQAAKEFSLPDNVEVSVTFVNDEEMRSLNKEYRGVDSSTDVLSFAFNEGECPAEELCIEDVTGLDLLGDIVISVERAILQAKEYNHGVDREIGFLTVHGMLHLLGFDHNDEKERNRMREMEEKILRFVGLTRDKSV